MSSSGDFGKRMARPAVSAQMQAAGPVRQSRISGLGINPAKTTLPTPEFPDQLDSPDSYLRSRSPDAYSGDHGVSFRVSFPTLFWGHYYFAAFAGAERRNARRLKREGQSSAGKRSVFFASVLLMMVGFAVFGGLCAAYLLKSALNIDLFEGGSFLHPLFEKSFR